MWGYHKLPDKGLYTGKMPKRIAVSPPLVDNPYSMAHCHWIGPIGPPRNPQTFQGPLAIPLEPLIASSVWGINPKRVYAVCTKWAHITVMFLARHDMEDLARHGGHDTTFFFGTERKDPARNVLVRDGTEIQILIHIWHIWECISRKMIMEANQSWIFCRKLLACYQPERFVIWPPSKNNLRENVESITTPPDKVFKLSGW